MVDTFFPGTLPGERSKLPILQSDIASFNTLEEVASGILRRCVGRRVPLAGWSYAGTSLLLGLCTSETSIEQQHTRR